MIALISGYDLELTPLDDFCVFIHIQLELVLHLPRGDVPVRHQQPCPHLLYRQQPGFVISEEHPLLQRYFELERTHLLRGAGLRLAHQLLLCDWGRLQKYLTEVDPLKKFKLLELGGAGPQFGVLAEGESKEFLELGLNILF